MSGLVFTGFSKGSSTLKMAEELYNENFDRRINVPFSGMVKASESGKADFIMIYNEDLFVGFYFVYHAKDAEYLYTISLVSDIRDRGYGTEVLDHIMDSYAGETLVTLIEAPRVDDKLVSAPYRRLFFFTKNGFTDSLYKFDSLGIFYQVLYVGEGYNARDAVSMQSVFRRICTSRH